MEQLKNKESIKEKLDKRANHRKKIAYIFLLLSLIIIVLGFIVFIYSMVDAVLKENINDFLTITTRLIFVVTELFLVQILLKHYRYNMLKADYYLSCSDSLCLIEEFKREGNEEDDKKFIALFSTLVAEKTPLDNVENPNIQLTNLSK